MFTVSRWLVSGIAAAAVMCSLATTATTQECRNRGHLDQLYCDEDNDLVADAPSDLKKLRDPATLTFTYSPVENPAVYLSVFKPLIDFLAQCSGKPFAYQPVQSNSAEIAAMRAGDLHVQGFRPGLRF